MLKISPLLMVILIAVIGFQTWQVHQLRQEVKDLKQQTATLAKAADGDILSSEDMKAASSLVVDGVSQLMSGNSSEAEKTLKEAGKLMERAMKDNTDGQKAKNKLDESRKSLSERLKGLYSPSKKEER